jgi:pyridoxamine 5'-phosphate oxidase
LAAVRRSYTHGSLDVDELTASERTDPLQALDRWIAEARTTGELEPTAMVLSTLGRASDGQLTPDSRVVLCKGLDHGVLLYTNSQSAKGRQLAAHPVASLVFHWASLERQLRVRGTVEVVDDATADAYFDSRPRGSQIGAWASDQTQPAAGPAQIEAAAAAARARFTQGPVPRPPQWGGYRVVPEQLELWQGRPDRLHDRLLATRVGDAWTWQRLQP